MHQLLLEVDPHVEILRNAEEDTEKTVIPLNINQSKSDFLISP